MSRLKRGHNSDETNKNKRLADCEIGTFSVLMDKNAISGMKPKQHLVSFAYRSMFLELSTMLSFRNVSDTMNRFLHKDPEHEVKVSTLEGRVESQGKALTAAYMEKAASILESHNIDAQSGIIDSNSPIAVSVRNATLPDVLSEKSVRQLITDYNRDRDTDTKLKYGSVTSMIEACAEDCCYISIDDIGVRFQKEERNNTYKKKQKFIENTVIHIQKGELQYTITAIGMKNAFMQLVAFLLVNNLMEGCRLVFLTDGANCIRENIETFFGFRQHTIILDWLHLEKKCNEYLCMAVKGKKEEKDTIKQDFAAILWTGRMDKAIKYLNNIKKANIKNDNKLDELRGYLNRKSPYLTCYALRHQLGLRTSSNRVEKANDIVVANRQKHNGMAWSKTGSGALAIITAAKVNGELTNWIATGMVNFKLVA